MRPALLTSEIDPLSLPNRVLTPSDAAKYLGLKYGTLANWRALGKGPNFLERDGRCWGYRLADLDSWLETQLKVTAG